MLGNPIYAGQTIFLYGRDTTNELIEPAYPQAIDELPQLINVFCYRMLVKLVEDGELELVGRGPGAHYEITEKGRKRSRY